MKMELTFLLKCLQIYAVTFLVCVPDSVVSWLFILFEKPTKVHQLKNPCFASQYEVFLEW